MTQIYEGMFLLDNQVVREDWRTAKAVVTETLVKHGGRVLSARRWDERRLAFPIRGRRRATYLLTYYELPATAIPTMRRDFDLSERVLRYLHTKVEAVPEGELALSEAENAADFSVPAPPPDDEPEAAPEVEVPARRGGEEASSEGGEKTRDGEPSGDEEKAEEKAEGGEAAADGEGAAPVAEGAAAAADTSKEG